jgi:hypothetical protein
MSVLRGLRGMMTRNKAHSCLIHIRWLLIVLRASFFFSFSFFFFFEGVGVRLGGVEGEDCGV